MNWTDTPVLLTGAGGFIGSHLLEILCAHGARVRAFLRYNSRNDPGLLRFLPPETLRRVEVMWGDLRDYNAVNQAMEGVRFVFHLGALIGIPYSYVNPREVVETNVLGTLNVLMAGREHGVSRIVHTSTSEVYGTARTVPIDTAHPLQAQSPYSASKIGADKIAQSFHASFDLPVVILRPFNTYGPRQSGRAVIPNIIAQVRSRDRVTLGSLHPTRDFTFVRDTARAFVRAAETPEVIGRELIVGSGLEISIGDLARKIMQLMGKEMEIVSDATRVRPSASEVERLLADNREARMLLGWSPEVSLEEGLRETIQWVVEHPAHYHSGDYLI
jgi:NAD dependent epimerase/dehydratase